MKPPQSLPCLEARRVGECSPSSALRDPEVEDEVEPPRPAVPPRSTELTSRRRVQLGGGECAAPTPSGTPDGNGGHVPIPWRPKADIRMTSETHTTQTLCFKASFHLGPETPAWLVVCAESGCGAQQPSV